MRSFTKNDNIIVLVIVVAIGRWAFVGSEIKQKVSMQVKNIKKDYFRLFLIISLIFIFFYPPFLRGLFFETEELFTEVLVLVVFLIYSIYKICRKDFISIRTPLEFVSIGFSIVYLFSIFYAVSTNAAIIEWLKYCMFFAIFIMVSDLFSNLKYKCILITVNIFAALVISIIGLDSYAAGNVIKVLNTFTDKIGLSKLLGLEQVFFNLSDGQRLYSTMQYPNALAAYLLCIFILCIGMFILSRKQRYKAIYSISAFITLTAMILTFSRGAYLVMPVAVILLSIGLPKGFKLRGLINIIIVLISSITSAIYLYTKYILTTILTNRLWLIIIAGALFTYIAMTIIKFILDKLESVSKKIVMLIYLVLGTIVVVAALYMIITTDKLTLQHSATEKDSEIVITKSLSLETGRTYRLSYTAEASMSGEKPNAYLVRVVSHSKNDILFGTQQIITEEMGKETNGVEEKSFEFAVPKDSEVIDIQFVNIYQGTEVTFYSAKVYDKASEKLVKNLKLNHKYIPQSIVSRFQNLSTNNSNIQRQVYYIDGLDILKNYKFGAGGGAWPYVYFAHQSFAYSTIEPHSFPLKLAIETGIFGILLIISLLAALIYLYFKLIIKEGNGNSSDNILKATAYSAIFTLLAHSFIDFDLSLTAIAILLWQLLGIANSKEEQKADKKVSVQIMIKPLLAVAITIVIIVFPVMILTAKVYGNQMVKASQENKLEEAINYAKKAISIYPYNAEHRLDYAYLILKKEQISQSELREVDKYVKKADKLARYDTELQTRVGAYYLLIGAIEDGLEHYKNLTSLKPFVADVWLANLKAQLTVAKYYMDKNEYDSAIKYLDEAFSSLESCKKVNSKNMKPFIFEDISVIKLLEDMNYIKNYTEILTNKDSVDINFDDIFNKLVFTSINDFDINNDNVPDQFSILDPKKTELYYLNDSIVWDSKEGASGIVSRKFELAAGKKYRIEIKAEGSDLASIAYTVSGVSGDPVKFTQSNGLLVADFETNTSYNLENSVLTLFGTGKINIGYIRVYEM